jgi:hypothetical protein
LPRATISTQADRFDLKSLEGAWVELRRMSYGKWLERSQLAMQIGIEAGSKNGMKGNIEMLNRQVTAFELKQCLVDHNLDDDNDEKMDLTKPANLDRLDPKVGQEIGELIRVMHEFGDDLGNSVS